MGRKIHTLSSVDAGNKTGVCDHCGPVEVKVNSSARRLTCAVAMRNDKRKYVLRTRYGMTPEQWDEMLISQLGRCASCNDPMREPDVDHCHATGVVRGMLCRACNHGLGLFYDNPARLLAAMRYLEKVAT